jgi:uncharacterized membrane protein YkvA (DUF1232 family)
MAILLRLAAFVGLWMFGRWRRNNAPPIAETVSKLPWTAKAKLALRLVQDKRVPVWARSVTLLPALYLASPIDLLPDFIPLIGRLDDAVVFGIVIDVLIRLVPAPVLQEHLESVSAAKPQGRR